MTIRPLYFLDEAIWRGRMLSTMSAIKMTVIEIGIWAFAIFASFPFAKSWPFLPYWIAGFAFLRFIFAFFDEHRTFKNIERDIMNLVK